MLEYFLEVFLNFTLETKNTSSILSRNNKTDQETERKVTKEAPSDPRRRRRTSESATPTTKEQTTPKKSPRQDEVPATKMRRSGSRNAMNTITCMFGSIQIK